MLMTSRAEAPLRGGQPRSAAKQAGGGALCIVTAYAEGGTLEGAISAQAKAGEGITTLNYEEWIECLARLGCPRDAQEVNFGA